MLVLGKFEGMMVRDKFCRPTGPLGTRFLFFTLPNKKLSGSQRHKDACKLSYLTISGWLQFSKTKARSFGLKFHLLQSLLTLLLDNPLGRGHVCFNKYCTESQQPNEVILFLQPYSQLREYFLPFCSTVPLKQAFQRCVRLRT